MSVGVAGLLGFLIVFIPSMFFLARWWNELGLKDLEPPREIEKKEEKLGFIRNWPGSQYCKSCNKTSQKN